MIESELLDLTGVSFGNLRADSGLEWDQIEAQLLRKLCGSAAVLAGDTTKPSWTV
ncbi:hypothetical protein B7755_049115 [Streptomyces sp. NBS 14/10]|uniref:hypothetical protein n=1 Tax=Streptomyces sp. NBS 14/10 TaxID=1945643 RepID=UPI0015C5FDE1|nr:hypothetical protein [Streptomyces sp. NBS 14/10]KAK1185352.1 hypothetical protein B7755_049115 [Streptomyces sp. NBS 14/10]NUP37876.1 hypothetical protein [Streptomyces sp.]NUS88828.1 hypothetical protein [Streptomyces sp.]